MEAAIATSFLEKASSASVTGFFDANAEALKTLGFKGILRPQTEPRLNPIAQAQFARSLRLLQILTMIINLLPPVGRKTCYSPASSSEERPRSKHLVARGVPHQSRFAEGLHIHHGLNNHYETDAHTRMKILLQGGFKYAHTTL